MRESDFIERIKQVESGGRRFGKDGNILEGPSTKYGTAKGEMQVLDSTTSNPGYGVVPARDGSPEERARVGTDYALAMLRTFNGDTTQAAAAYNHGPGNVQKLIVKYGDEWQSKLPAETKNYVSKVGGASIGPSAVVQAPATAQETALAQVAPPLQAQGTGLVELPPELLAHRSSAVASQATAQADAWAQFLKSMPANRQAAVQPTDLSYGAQPVAIQAPSMGRAPAAVAPNFAAFQAWGGKRA